MLVIPAIDLREGKCVRLYQGRREEETVFSDDPVAVAQNWEARGASYLHLVDLDGAFAGRPANLATIQGIMAGIRIPVQVGGGLRRLEDIEHVLSLGVSRVVIGTVAISRPELVAQAVQRFGPERVAVGIDSKDGWVAVEGWETVVEKKVTSLLAEMRKIGVRWIVYTDTWRDGTLEGLNIAATRAVARESGMRVIASGGVSSLDDIINLRELEPLGVEGVIVGRSLYTGAISLEEALQAASKTDYPLPGRRVGAGS